MFKPQPANALSPSQTSNAPAKPHADIRKLKAKAEAEAEAGAEVEAEAGEASTEVGT